LHLTGIDGSILRLRDARGFREFIKSKADELHLTGTIQRTRGTDAILVFEGSVVNTNQFIAFIKQCRSQGMIGSFNRPNLPVNIEDSWFGDFAILRSRSKQAVRGRYSSQEYEKLSEYSYGDAKDVVNSPDIGYGNNEENF